MICPNCQNPITKKYNKFCGSACAASFNNKNRAPRSSESKRKTSDTILATCRSKGLLTSDQPDFKEKISQKRKERRIAKREAAGILPRRRGPKPKEDIIVGEFTRLVRSECATCSVILLAKSYQKYCRDHSENYTRGLRSRFNFKFKVDDYPELLDLKMIETHGWYSPGGKSTLPINHNGVTRDHKVSVHSAITNDYDPFYITHPLNCELMLHSENNRKNTLDSLTYQELKSMVDTYEANKKPGQ